jgi:ribonuclease HI
MGWMKINVDGSFDATLNTDGTGIVMRDYSGKVYAASCAYLNRCSSALEAELLAIRNGIMLAYQWTLRPCIVETDCLEAVHLLQMKGKILSDQVFLVREVCDLMTGVREILLRKVHRSVNSGSHFLANKARCEACSKDWLERDCDELQHLVISDLSPE